MNNCVFIGRLVQTPEVKDIHSNDREIDVCNFTIAVYSAKPVKGQENNALFFDCRAWGGQANFLAKNFTKGQNIGVSGEMRYDVYEKDEKKKRSYFINVQQVSFCESKGKSEASYTEQEIIDSIPDYKE